MKNRRPYYLTLDFFASRYNIPVEKLSWAIILGTDGCETWLIAAIMIRNSDTYINIKEDNLGTCVKDSSTDRIDYVYGAFLDREYRLIYRREDGLIFTYDLDEPILGMHYARYKIGADNFEPYEMNTLNPALEEIFTLTFFANHFRVHIEKLSWCVMEPTIKINQNEKDKYCIDICWNTIASCPPGYCRQSFLYDATLKNSSLHYRDSKGKQCKLDIDMSIVGIASTSCGSNKLFCYTTQINRSI